MNKTAKDDPLVRLGNAVRIRREELGLQQTDLKDRGGPSSTTLSLIERGLYEMTPLMLRRLDDGLDWIRGSAADVLSGIDPSPIRLAEERRPTVPSTPPPRDPLADAWHLSTHTWSVAAEFVAALANADCPPAVKQAASRLLAVYGEQIVLNILRFEISDQDRDAILADHYKHRHEAQQLLGGTHVLEVTQKSSAPETGYENEEDGFDEIDHSLAAPEIRHIPETTSVLPDLLEDPEDTAGLIGGPGVGGDVHEDGSDAAAQ